jgi:hypothetical protein
MFKLALWILTIYIIYKFVFELVVPVTKTASQLKKNVQNIQEEQLRQQYQQQQYTQQTHAPKANHSTSANEGEYIEFEEIK